jgi:MoxR-like ATPase
MATQNPIEQEGTYPLPEAQVDRFMFKVKVTYGTERDEIEMLQRSSQGILSAPVSPVLSRSDIIEGRQLIASINVSEKIHQYIVNIVFCTREPGRYGISEIQPWISVGASPRASLFLEKAGRVNAALMGRNFITPQDIKDIALDVLRHRISLSYAAEAEQIEADKIVQKILDRVEVP